MRKLKPLLALILLVVFICSTSMMMKEQQASQIGQDTYEAALTLATENAEVTPLSTPDSPPRMVAANLSDNTITDDPNLEFLAGIDLAALQAVNPDVIGWFFIPGTNISYPLLQDDNNQHYMSHTWDNQSSYVGSILLECKNDPDLEDFNTMIYGHNLVNKTMFSQLHLYKDLSFWEQNPYAYIVTETGIYRYQIFAAFEVPATSNAFRVRFHDETQKEEFLADILAWNTLDTGITPDTQDNILTLCTCTGVIKTNRWVVQAVLEGQLLIDTDSDGIKFSHGLNRALSAE